MTDLPAALRVLAVEDNPGDVELVREALHGFAVVESLDRIGQLAERLRTTGMPDAILLDLSLPDAHGLDGLEQARTLAPDVPIVVLTGCSGSALGTQALRLGAEDYLSKQEASGQLLSRTVNYAVERHRSRHREALLLAEKCARDEAERAAEALRRANALIEGITTATDDLIAAVDGEFRYLFFNEAYRAEFKRLWGVDVQLGMNVVELLAPWPEAQRRAHATWGLALQGDSVRKTTTFGRRAPDSVYDLRANPIHDSCGRRIGAACIFRNVTEQARMHEAAREGEARLRFALKAGESGTFEWDARTNSLRWSQELLSLYGIKAGHFGARYEDWLACVVAEDRAPVAAALQDSLETGTLAVQFRIRHRDSDETRWMDARGQVFFEDGVPVRVAGIHVDITQRKQAEDALYAKTEQLESLITSAPLGLAFFDRQHRYVQINAELAAIDGIPHADHIGRTMEELLPVNARIVAPVLDRVFQTGEAVRDFEVTGETPREPGVQRHWLTGFYPVRDRHGAVVMVGAWVAEISERKRGEEALREAHQRKDEFLAMLSHELRNPLAPVLTAVELMQRQPRVSAEIAEPLDIIRRNVQVQARLIDDLLDLTRIAQGKLELKRKPVDLGTVIERAVEVVRSDLRVKRLHFRVALKDTLRIEADAARIQQVVWNLLSNAAKFTPEGGCVALCCERQGPRAVIEVTDSGIGIEPQHAKKIFDAFEQGEPAIRRRFGGMGLGLAIARRLVDMHDGTISVHSAGRDRGATFRVELPLGDAAAMPEISAGAAPTEALPRRVLLVEDHGDSALMMKMLLESLGCQVKAAADAGQALQSLESSSFDLLISDIGLPGLSGIELMRQVRRRGHALKAISLSGYGQEEDVRRSRQAGFSAHLVKPIDLDALTEVLAGM